MARRIREAGLARRFFVGLFATIGFIIILLVVAGTGFFFWLRPAEKPVAEASILSLDLTEPLAKAPAPNPLDGLLFEARPSLRQVLDGIDRAARDPRVKAIFARIGGDDYGFATVQELRDAIAAFRATGKPAFAFADSFGEFGQGTRSYYLATAFDEIWMQPLGSVGLTGIRSESPFLRGTLDKLGVEPRFDHRSEYKTAMNMLTEKEMTAPHREEIEAILRSVHDQVVAAIAERSRIPRDEAERLAGHGPYLDQEALSGRLVDHLGYRDEAFGALQRKTGGKAIRLKPYLAAAGAPNRAGTRIALIYGTGIIARGESEQNPLSGGGVMGAESVVAAFRAAVADPKVRAILFRVDSPGGSAIASETIWRETVRAQKAGKKVVVSMGDVAGSGGYYVAAAADRIVAEPATLTGSIGVVAGKMLLNGFWEKLGVSWGTVEIGENAGMFSALEDWTPEEHARFENGLDAIYAGFKSRVAEGRKLSADAVEAVAKGRVWTGEQAKSRGLVDVLGGFDEALRQIRAVAGLGPDEPIELRTYPAEESARDLLMALLFGEERQDRRPDTALRRALVLLRPLLGEIERAGAGPVTMPAIEPR